MKKKKRIIWTAVALVAILAVCLGVYAVLWHNYRLSLEITLNQPQELTLEYGASYEEPGARAEVRGGVLHSISETLPVDIQGTVDTGRLGDYTVRYSASYSVDHFLGNKEIQKTVERTVHVVDTQEPVITLETQVGSYTLPGREYQEEGFSAYDDCDGDLTSQVERQILADKIIYRVSDASGNVAQVERPIVYDDPVPPVLTLLGDSKVSLVVGETFKEPGYTAVDNCDGDITAMVQVTGALDTGTVGSYTLTYTVMDAFGNQTVLERTVTVSKPKNPMPTDPVGGVIYLTFDDGPSGYTEQLLDILDKYGVKATFFVVGTKDLSLLPRMAASGHTVAMHTNSHSYKKMYASEKAYFEDLYAIESRIREEIGYAPKILRFPGGSSNLVSKVSMSKLCKAVEDKGYHYFDWNVDSMDAGGASSSDEVFYNVICAVAKRSSAVVLQHDTKGFSVNAVERIIQWGLENGYTFQALAEDSPECHHRTAT